jgi:hypothetical protein
MRPDMDGSPHSYLNPQGAGALPRGGAMRTQTGSLRCPQCGQAATMTLKVRMCEPHRSTLTHVIALECSNSEPHDPLPQSELLNLWVALWA